MPFISTLEPAVFLYIMATISDGLTALGWFQYVWHRVVSGLNQAQPMDTVNLNLSSVSV